MNERNVEALVNLLNDQSFAAPLDRSWCREMAAFIAALRHKFGLEQKPPEDHED